MTDELLAAMHGVLARYHRSLAKNATLDIVQQYHADLAQRFADEAAQIPRRTTILERLHERQQQEKQKLALSANDVAGKTPDKSARKATPPLP